MPEARMLKVKLFWETELKDETELEKFIKNIDAVHADMVGPQNNCVARELSRKGKYKGAINNIKMEKEIVYVKF